MSLFFFIWIMNVMGLIPLVQFPATSRIAFPAALLLIVWVLYMTLGIKHQGLVGYFKNMAIPQGAPWWILPLLAPVELLSSSVVRPFTLGVRLFANMFAGHLLLLIFTLATWYLLSLSVGLRCSPSASFALVIVLTALEVLIRPLQAFIFATLTASYIAGSLEAVALTCPYHRPTCRRDDRRTDSEGKRTHARSSHPSLADSQTISINLGAVGLRPRGHRPGHRHRPDLRPRHRGHGPAARGHRPDHRRTCGSASR